MLAGHTTYYALKKVAVDPDISLSGEVGTATWLAAGVVAAICGLLSSDAFVWMGVGFQARARESLSCPFALLM